MKSIYQLFLNKKDLNIHKWHHYFPIYQRHFEKYIDKEIKFLEIGIQRGGSTILFRDWLGKKVKITAIDIDPVCKNHLQHQPQIEFVIGDQANIDFLKNLAKKHGPWDIILDDGGHTCNQVLTSFETLYPFVNENGVYLIEDLNTHFWKEEFDDHPQKKTVKDLLLSSFEKMHDWTKVRSLYNYWHKPLNERTTAIPASNFCKTTGSVHCYDGVLVFEKLQRQEPYSEWRGAKGKEQKDLDNIPNYIANPYLRSFKQIVDKIKNKFIKS